MEGIYDTGITWARILSPSRRTALRALMKRHNVPEVDIERLINSLVTKTGTVKVVVGTRPVRAPHDYVRGYSGVHGTPAASVEVHHGDPLYLGGGHGPDALLGLTGAPHDDVHAFFDALTLPSGPFAGTPLQPTRLQTAVGASLRPAAAVVRPDGSVDYEVLTR